MAQFNSGDVVQLKSGGPLMTVSGGDANNTECNWFDDKKQFQSRSFPTSILEKYDPRSAFGLA